MLGYSPPSSRDRVEAPCAATVGLAVPRLAEGHVVQGMSSAYGIALTAGDQLLAGILSDGLEQAVPGLSVLARP